jgi:hypothetical protein
LQFNHPLKPVFSHLKQTNTPHRRLIQPEALLHMMCFLDFKRWLDDDDGWGWPVCK